MKHRSIQSTTTPPDYTRTTEAFNEWAKWVREQVAGKVDKEINNYLIKIK